MFGSTLRQLTFTMRGKVEFSEKSVKKMMRTSSGGWTKEFMDLVHAKLLADSVDHLETVSIPKSII